MPTTFEEAFSLARTTEARFEAIAHKEKATAGKEQSIKKTTNTIISVSSAIDGVFVIGESNVESIEVPSKFNEFSENKESVEKVVVGGGEALEVDEYASNRVILVLKDGCGEFDDSLSLSEDFVTRALEGRDVFGEKSRKVFSVTP
nr:hypothetical protein [Tanacetum cinerariifolium]